MGAMDSFFWYGNMDLEDEIQEDVKMVLTQRRGGLFYDRAYGAGLPWMENGSSELQLTVGARFYAVQAISERNQRVSDGTNGPDRRVAASQQAVGIEREGDRVAVNVLYISLNGQPRPSRVNIPVGVQ